MKHTIETTEISAPLETTIACQSLICGRWKVKMTDPEVSHLRLDHEGSVRPYMHLPHLPESESETEITLTFRGEDSTKLRIALQAVAMGKLSARVKTERKAAASRENGKKGGRPRRKMREGEE